MLAFTSFKRVTENSSFCQKMGVHVVSIASHQPRGMNYDEARFLAPIDRHGRDIRMAKEVDLSDPVRYIASLSQLRMLLNDAFMSRLDEIRHWASTLDRSTPTILCSWPPYSNASRRQLAEFGVFACHSSAVSEIVSMLRPDIKIAMDKDRSIKMVNLCTTDDRSLSAGFDETVLLPQHSIS